MDDGPVRRVLLDRPPVNALSAPQYAALAEGLAVPGRGAARVVVLAATGATWCAGQDTTEFARLVDGDRRAAHLVRAAEAVTAVLRCPVPVVAAVQGPAVGAGALLAAAADVTVLTEDAWWSVPELALGVAVGRAVLDAVLPGPVVRRLLLTGERVAARRLLELGAVTAVVPVGELPGEAGRWAARLAALDDGTACWLRGGPERAAVARAYEAEVTAAAGVLRAGAPGPG